MTATVGSMKTSWKPLKGIAPVLQACLRSFWCALLCWLLSISAAHAGLLTDRLAAFPEWNDKPAVQPAEGDLEYPAWLAGTWTMTSTLVDLAAPLSPEVVTPGFDSNQQYLKQPIACKVRFVPSSTLSMKREFLSLLPLLPFKGLIKDPVVSDRAFNGFNLAKAYMGDSVLAVTVDPRSPNRQMTLLQGGRQLISVVTARAVETPDDKHFLTTELFQQVFRGVPNPYLNQVETTTAYQHLPNQPKTPIITADQVTAIYLSPQDSQYFKAGNRPVALYRYRLEFTREEGDQF